MEFVPQGGRARCDRERMVFLLLGSAGSLEEDIIVNFLHGLYEIGEKWYTMYIKP